MPLSAYKQGEHMKVSIILPAFNEAMTIDKVISDFHAALPHAEIWVIDNNSQDGTGDIARALFIKRSIPGGVLSEHRQGKSFAVRKDFRAIEADVYVMCDADSTYPASELPHMIEILLNTGADMVVGDRLSKGHYMESTGRIFHRTGNSLVRLLINFLFKGQFRDVQVNVLHDDLFNAGCEIVIGSSMATETLIRATTLDELPELHL